MGLFSGLKRAWDKVREAPSNVKDSVQNTLNPELPELPDEIEAPVPDDEKRLAARKRQAQRKYKGAGRAGTMLTSDDSRLG